MKTVCSVAQTRNNDLDYIESGASPYKLMLNAGKALLFSYDYLGKKTLIVCGGGNNGGDGLVLALLLKEKGCYAEVCLAKANFTEESVYYYNKCQKAGIKCYSYTEDTSFEGFDIIVDAIFGTGFIGAVKPPIDAVINKINSSKAVVISADIPSGLNGDNGRGQLSVQAQITVAINNLKSGYYLGDGKDRCGKIKLAPIGIPIEESLGYLIEKTDLTEIFPPRKYNSNKGSYGYVGLIGGSVKYSGAVKLANLALSALKVGSGVVKLGVPSCIASSVLPYLVESTLMPLPDKKGMLKFNKSSYNQLIGGLKAIAFGVGVGDSVENEKILRYLLASFSGTLIIDADGLNALSRMGVDSLLEKSCRVILTPHPKEFSRLCGKSVDEILNNPIELAKEFSKKYNVTLLLKGASTIVCDSEALYITERGSSGMATAGSGDCLTGVILGLCGFSDKPLSKLAIAGAYICGVAGERATESINAYSHTARDTIEFIPKVISEIIK